MKKYRSKVVEIEAIQWDGTLGSAFEIQDWCKSFGVLITVSTTDNVTSLIIPTLEGDMRASVTDYIIRGTENEAYPCKESVFTRKYESAQ